MSLYRFDPSLAALITEAIADPTIPEASLNRLVSLGTSPFSCNLLLNGLFQALDESSDSATRVLNCLKVFYAALRRFPREFDAALLPFATDLRTVSLLTFGGADGALARETAAALHAHLTGGSPLPPPAPLGFADLAQAPAAPAATTAPAPAKVVSANLDTSVFAMWAPAPKATAPKETAAGAWTPFAKDSAPDPFAQFAAPPAANSADPFAQAGGADPFGAAGGDPFTGGGADPFGAAGGDPFAQPSGADPFAGARRSGSADAGADPFAAAGGGDPFAGARPSGSADAGADPFAAAGGGDPFAGFDTAEQTPADPFA